jgi:hypothetical protein
MAPTLDTDEKRSGRVAKKARHPPPFDSSPQWRGLATKWFSDQDRSLDFQPPGTSAWRDFPRGLIPSH